MAILLLLSSCNEDDKPTGPGPTAPDTTSHDFVWDITQIGVRHTSIDDVEAISDTDVWICGEIHFPDTYQNDSLGNIIKPFNAAHWDGKEWTYHRFSWQPDDPLEFRYISSIKAFAHDNVWFLAAGACLGQWDGKTLKYWKGDPFSVAGALQILEGTPGNLYMAGLKGAMMHFDGEKHFTSIYSGTNQDINDMCLAGNIIIAVANNLNDVQHLKPVLLIIDGTKITQWYDSLMYEGLSALWFLDKENGFITGPTLRRYMHGNWTAFTPPAIVFFQCIRGTAMNDVFVAGDNGVIHHFNGATWHFFQNFVTANYYKPHNMTYIEDNVWITWQNAKQEAFIIHGRRR